MVTYQLFISVCRWVIGEGALNEFAFSPCCRYLATVSQDGFLRVFNYDSMDLLGIARSYFGGLLCVCWSPDGKYVVTGGEDDLVTVWSFNERRVVARGHGHKSWVSVVAFDSYTTCFGEGRFDFKGSEDDLVLRVSNNHGHPASGQGDCAVVTNVNSCSEGSEKMGCTPQNCSRLTGNSSWTPRPVLNTSAKSLGSIACYRFGSLGQDTQLCLWDLTEDIFKQPLGRSRTSMLSGHGNSGCCGSVAPTSTSNAKCCNSTNAGGNSLSDHQLNASVPLSHTVPNCVSKEIQPVASDGNVSSTTITTPKDSGSHKFGTLTLSSDRKDKQSHSQEKDHKRNFSLASRSSDKNAVIKLNSAKSCGPTLQDGPVKLIGTPNCPRLDEVPFLEPLVCKKIAHERLTALVFREECIVTACQEGFVCTWARPGKVVGNKDGSDDHIVSSSVT